MYIPLNAAAAAHTVGATAQTLAAASVTVPAGARYAEGYVRTDSISMYRDGSTPTATAGEQWDAGDTIVLRSRDEIDKAQFIRVAASATINWTFFSGPGY